MRTALNGAGAAASLLFSENTKEFALRRSPQQVASSPAKAWSWKARIFIDEEVRHPALSPLLECERGDSLTGAGQR
jgi:hypothetical protein